MQTQNLATELADLRQAYEKSLSQNTELAISLQLARNNLQALMNDPLTISNNSNKTKKSNSEIEKLQRDIQKKSEEIARLNQVIENMKQSRVDTMADSPVTRAFPDVVIYAQNLERTHQAVLDSTSWRLTSPMRVIVDGLKGRKYQAYTPKLEAVLKQHGL